MTTREFEAEEGKNVIWYQSLRLYNEGLVPRSKVFQPEGLGLGEESKFSHGSNYSELKFVGVGGDTGKEDIWNESLFHQIKPNVTNGKKIKLAIGITMYNEDWEEFHRTIKGVVQGIADLYNDHKISMKEHAEPWDSFKEQFIIILLADGYQNINKEFKAMAEKNHFFREEAIKDKFFKAGADGKAAQLMSIQEIN